MQSPQNQTQIPTLLPSLPPSSSPLLGLTPTSPPTVFADWVQLGSDVDGEALEDESGISVSLSSDGTILAVGALRNDGAGINAGHARVYSLLEGEWVRRGGDVEGEAAGDRFGMSVSLSSDGLVLAVGASEHDGTFGVGSGQVRVFDWNGTFWVARGRSVDGQAAGDDFGVSVALSSDGTFVAAGAWSNDRGGSNAGQVRIFSWDRGSWLQRGTGLDGESANDWLGYSISLSSNGSVVAMGGHGNNDNGVDSGQARVFQWTGTAWSQLGPNINGLNANDEFGGYVSLSGDGTVVAIGAHVGNYCRVYGFDGDDWVGRGQILQGEAGGDWFGFSVALSLNGNTVVIGAPLNDDNGANSGHARVYRFTPARWVQVGKSLVGESSGDRFGWSVAISDDATRVAIGGPRNRGSTGHVRVYELI